MTSSISNKAKVLRVFPEAWILKEKVAGGIWTVRAAVLPSHIIIGHGPTPRQAWKDAAQHPEVADKIAH